jgi:hypothetical protein
MRKKIKRIAKVILAEKADATLISLNNIVD